MFSTLILWIIQVIAFWAIFTKAGEPGWKSIIPVYNIYILFKIAWKTSMFWLVFGGGIVMNLFFANEFFSEHTFIPDLLMFVFAIVAFAVTVLLNLKLSKAFGHGIGFALGLLFLNPVLF